MQLLIENSAKSVSAPNQSHDRSSKIYESFMIKQYSWIHSAESNQTIQHISGATLEANYGIIATIHHQVGHLTHDMSNSNFDMFECGDLQHNLAE